MNVTKELVNDRVSESGGSSGCHCLFINLGNMGLKLYVEKDFCEATKALQGTAHADGFAPKAWGYCEMELDCTELGSKLCCPWPDSFRRAMKDGKVMAYGYFTELAEMNLNSEEMENLIDDMSAAGYITSDLWYTNAGRVNGKPVCIDFDVKYNGKVLD
jgi:hypothetical protein